MIPLTEMDQSRMNDNCAILVKGACKQYGHLTSATVVLDNLNMAVPKGTIYGLLGASGCGKTTLLSCVVGTRTLDSGDILVLGENPSVITNWNMAYRIGYMPQENALIAEFSVMESVYYFGWLHGMRSEDLEENYRVLSDLLELPPDKQLIRTLSGGQLRRVSLASTLVHNPELLILDEPTVGLDPVLREGTWNHLFKLVKRGTTIIITTHYIEEARQANKIGLMRNGKLLAEDSPDHLISECQCTSLEEVFLLLSSGKRSRPTLLSTDDFNHSQPNLEQETDSEIVKNPFNTSKEIPTQQSQTDLVLNPVIKFSHKRSHPFRHKLWVQRTLLYKNYIKTYRFHGSLFFIIFFPLLNFCTFFLSVGHIPQGQKVAVTNEGLGNYSNCDEMLRYQPLNITLLDTDECYISDLSCLFLNSIDESFTEKVYYSDLTDSLHELSKGNVMAVIHMSKNFTSALQYRIEAQNSVPEYAVPLSEIQVFVDFTEKQLSEILRMKYLDAFFNFTETVVTSCGRPIKLAHIPMDFKTPVYGHKYITYTSFMFAGMIISAIYFLTAAVSAIYVILDKNESIWDRSLVAGVTEVEMFFAYSVTQSVQLVIQIATLLLTSFYVFNVEIPEKIGLAIVLVFLQGFAGMSYGFLISALCDDILNANYIILGLFMPYILISGFIWPVQCMPWILRYFSYFIPGTLSIEGLRAIMFRNWGFKELQVALGFINPGIYIILQMIICIFIIKHRK